MYNRIVTNSVHESSAESSNRQYLHTYIHTTSSTAEYIRMAKTYQTQLAAIAAGLERKARKERADSCDFYLVLPFSR